MKRAWILMPDPFSPARGPITEPTRDYVPLPLPNVDPTHHHRSLRRHPVRLATIGFAFLAAAATIYALLTWLIPDPVPALALLILAFLCPVALALTGFWVMSSVRSGHRISRGGFVLALGVTLAWWYAGNLETMGERAGFAIVIVGPAVIMLLLTHYLMTIRRSQIMRPIL
ncbi:MAG: hypothetical protein WBA46_07180 [Thermomicrobiales bacterium]